MTGLIQFKGYTAQLNTALTDLTAHCKSNANTSNGDGEFTPSPLLHSDSSVEAQEARRHVLSNIAQLQILLTEPAELLQELALKSQILACISWLGEFQVLACIPLQGAVPTKDVAEIIGVPESQLRRIVHLTASAAGFLQEPRPGHIAHSALTAPFVARPSYLDAATFLSDLAAPAALHMTRATQRFGESERESESALNVALNTDSTFAEMCERQSKLQRQWPAYLHHALGGDGEPSAEDVAACFDWRSLGTAAVVEIGAQSITTALALATLNPSLRITVQMNSESPPSSLSTSNLANLTSSSMTNGNTAIFAGQAPHSFSNTNDSAHADSNFTNSHYGPPFSLNSSASHSNGINGNGVNGNSSSGNSMNGTHGTTSYDSFSLTKNITIEKRHPASPQPIEDAAVYILHLPSASPTITSSSSSTSSTASAEIIAEIRTHLPILRANNRSRILLITPRILSESGREAYSADAAAASLRDMTMLQLCNDHSLSGVELRELVHRVTSGGGGGGDVDNGADHPLVVVGELRNGRGGVVGVEVGWRAGNGYDGC